MRRPNTPVPIESEDGYTTLQEGDSGEAVKALQTKLKELGFFTGTPLGNYKSLTVAAVRAYQAKNGLTVDGVASPALQKRIFEETVPGVTSTPTIEPSGETLKYGSTGESVKALQRALQELGYFSGSIGGNYLAQTEAAVQRLSSCAQRPDRRRRRHARAPADDPEGRFSRRVRFQICAHGHARARNERHGGDGQAGQCVLAAERARVGQHVLGDSGHAEEWAERHGDRRERRVEPDHGGYDQRLCHDAVSLNRIAAHAFA